MMYGHIANKKKKNKKKKKVQKTKTMTSWLWVLGVHFGDTFLPGDCTYWYVRLFGTPT